MKRKDPSDTLRKCIIEAFPSSWTLTHEECVELRAAMVSLHDKDIINLIGLVLVDLMETHAGSRPNRTDSVVRLLSGANPPPLESNSRLESYIQEGRAAEAVRVKESLRLFDEFNKAQVDAICKWLEDVRSWEADEVHEEELNAAIYFWARKRMAMGRG